MKVRDAIEALTSMDPEAEFVVSFGLPQASDGSMRGGQRMVASVDSLETGFFHHIPPSGARRWVGVREGIFR